MSETEYSDDPELEPQEKQFSVVGTKNNNRVRIHSEIGSVTRRVCQHPEAKIERKRERDGTVVAVTATLPVSCLSIKGKPRANDHWGQVVSGGVLNAE